VKKYEFLRYLKYKKEHEQFIAKVKEFRRRYGMRDLAFSFDVLKFLKD
jgi:hemerythrin